MTNRVTSHEAGRILGGTKPISPRTLAYWRSIGFGPEYVRIGKSIRYPIEGLQRFLEQNHHV